MAYQEQIYLKSDNHLVHLMKSSAALAAWPQPLCLLGACGVCNECREAGAGTAAATGSQA